MNLSLPDSLQDWIQTQASKAGKTPDEYVLDVLRAAQVKAAYPDDFLREAIADTCGEEAVTDEAIDKCKRGIEARLIEGLESGEPIEVNEAFWQERRRVLQERIATRKKVGDQ